MEFTTAFATTAYGAKLTGTASGFGWTPDETTRQAIAAMEPAKASRAQMRCMRAASKAHTAAWDRKVAAGV